MARDNLDALIILGGNGSRYKQALKAYKKHGPLNIVCTGRYTGLYPTYSGKPESILAKDYLLENNVPEEIIKTEEVSLDTISNAVYSWSILEDIGANRIGVITDNFHMDRAVETLESVLDPSYEFFPIPTGEKRSKIWMFIERIIRIAQVVDLKLLNIKPGDKERFKEYIEKEHAFHGSEPFGLYYSGARGMNFLTKYFSGFIKKITA